MVTIFDVARYILHKTGQITTMKLQKLCYYAQAWSLVWDDAPLFEEDFQAWANGPVCKELFDQHKGSFYVFENSPCVASGNPQALDDTQRETIDAVLDHYGDKDSQWLSDLTHMEGPWREARQGLPMGTPCSNIITKDSMAMYYGSL